MRELSRLFYCKYPVLVLVMLILAPLLTGASITDDRSPTINRRGLPTPYCFANFCRQEKDEWIVGGGGWILHLSTYADKHEQHPTEEDLVGVYFVNSSVGWVVGYNGTILRTLDGEHWEPQSSGTDHTLKAINCVDENHCWAVGVGGVILRTEDGGQMWLPVESPVTDNLNAVDFINKDIGWAASHEGRVLRTLDGGRSWKKSESGIILFPHGLTSKGFLLAVKFANEKLGWVAGGGGLARTTDGGVTWEVKIEEETFVGLVSRDGKNVWAIDEWGKNQCSNDGGQTWKKCPSE